MGDTLRHSFWRNTDHARQLLAWHVQPHIPSVRHYRVPAPLRTVHDCRDSVSETLFTIRALFPSIALGAFRLPEIPRFCRISLGYAWCQSVSKHPTDSDFLSHGGLGCIAGCPRGERGSLLRGHRIFSRTGQGALPEATSIRGSCRFYRSVHGAHLFRVDCHCAGAPPVSWPRRV